MFQTFIFTHIYLLYFCPHTTPTTLVHWVFQITKYNCEEWEEVVFEKKNRNFVNWHGRKCL